MRKAFLLTIALLALTAVLQLQAGTLAGVTPPDSDMQ